MIAHEPPRLPDRRHGDAACSTARPARWRRSSKRRKRQPQAGGRDRLPSAADRRRHMHNKVVTMTARALRESGITTVRFNFRGTGAVRAARFDDGEGEVDDLRAVARVGARAASGCALWLAGFSFGAYVTLQVRGRAQARHADLDRAAGVRSWLGLQHDRAAGMPVAGDPGRGRRDRRSAGGLRLDRQPHQCASRPNWCACPTPVISSIVA